MACDRSAAPSDIAARAGLGVALPGLLADTAPMTLLLRRQNAQDRREGHEPLPWKPCDFAVLDDERRVGRMYREQLPVGVKWCWFIQITGAPAPNQGTAGTLDEAMIAFKERYEVIYRPK